MPGRFQNSLFLVYVALFSASLFGLVLSLTSFDVQGLPAHFTGGLPWRGIGLFLVVSGAILLLVWLVLSIVPALFQGTAPAEVASYTTFITGVVDIGIVAPALIVAGVLLLRRASTGYLLAAMMLVFTVALGPTLTVAGIAQLLTGVISIGQFIGMTVPFMILMLIAIWLTIVLFRNIAEAMTPQEARTRVAHA